MVAARALGVSENGSGGCCCGTWDSEDAVRAYKAVVRYRELDLPSLHYLVVANSRSLEMGFLSLVGRFLTVLVSETTMDFV